MEALAGMGSQLQGTEDHGVEDGAGRASQKDDGVKAGDRPARGLHQQAGGGGPGNSERFV